MTKVQKRKDLDGDRPRTCSTPGCTGSLDEQGFCLVGGGWPLASSCPDVCPECRQPVKWDGACLRCWKPGGEMPGYYHEQVNGHWRKTVNKARACTMAETIACMQTVKAVLSGSMTVERGIEEQAAILNPEVPF